MLENVKEWKTTILGVVTLVISGLVIFGVITPENSAEINANTITISEAIVAIVTGVSGIINIFRAK